MYKHVKTYRNKVRDAIYTGFGAECCICAYSKEYRALQLHHVDKSEKSFNLSAWSSHRFSDILDESEKCVMLCANCHAEVEAGSTQLPEDARRFNREAALERWGVVTRRRRKKNRKVWRCKDCGKRISVGASRCKPCYIAFTKRKVE